MSDFFQNGVITTLHRLRHDNIAELEDKLLSYSKTRPIALVLPLHAVELEGEALPGIVAKLATIPYLHEVVVTLGGAGKEQFIQAKKYFAQLPQFTAFIWNDGPRLDGLYNMLAEEFGPRVKGKGLSAWMAYGYVLAGGECRVIALHDSDILTYSTELLARLCFPAVSTRLNYEFCKGYYARISDRMHGRATRLFITPLIRSLMDMLGPLPFLVYLDSFRYPLAGEFAMHTDLAWRTRIPSDWGLEIGVLSEIYRNCSLNSVCQVDLADNYEHKHQSLSAGDTTGGLMKMTIDIAKTLFRNLAASGVVFSDGFFKTLRTAYVRQAQDMIKHYHDDAQINSLSFDRHSESIALEAFAESINLAGQRTLEDPLGIPLIPNWSRVLSAMPDFFDYLQVAVAADKEES
jgi:glucosyl-3-phosphoglycerate synthase